ncbi:MAG: glycosyltransferase family 39 protein [Lachnospiraceae bacterium]|nr:glycosyltransferase family 39 protein [Lachnospiraceae bacterium]
MQIKKKKYILMIMILAFVSRVVLINKCPGGVHADEAFSGYEAWSLLHYGMDSAGYSNPVYLTVWGGGMSVLNSLLMIPGIILFGLNTVTVKFPVIFMGVVSVFVFYLLLKRTVSEKTALWGSFLLAVSPWHIMISRYGMDANLCPAFVLIAMYLTVLGIEDNRRLKWAAAAWGIALYSYVVLWIFEPIFLLLLFLYCFKNKKVNDFKQIVIAVIILAVIALPLILFICVNMGIIPEIRTGILSIPVLEGFRSGELGVGGYMLNIKRLVRCFVLQNDGYLWNSIPGFGVYYLFSTPISVVGFIVVLKKAVSDFKKKNFGYEMILLIWLVSAVIMAFTQTTGTNLTRINPINLAMFILVVIGIQWIISKIRFQKAEIVAARIYVASFLCFMAYYFTGYSDAIAQQQLAGARDALSYADELYETGLYGDKIYISGPLRHSQVLFYTQLPTDEYIATVEQNLSEDGTYNVKSFGCFMWGDLTEYGNRNIYVIPSEQVDVYTSSGFEIRMFDRYAVAVPFEGGSADA